VRGIPDQHTLTELGWHSRESIGGVGQQFPIFVGLRGTGFMEAQRALEPVNGRCKVLRVVA